MGMLKKRTRGVFVAFVQIFSSHPQEHFNAHSDIYISPLKHMKDPIRVGMAHGLTRERFPKPRSPEASAQSGFSDVSLRERSDDIKQYQIHQHTRSPLSRKTAFTSRSKRHDILTSTSILYKHRVFVWNER